MLLPLFTCLLLVSGTIFGLAWPLAARLQLAPLEKVGASVLLSLLGVWLAGWAVFVFSVPRTVLWVLPALAALGLAADARKLAQLWRDPDVRGLAAAQVLVTAWCLGWLALIRNYTGGLWAFDWFEHWERTRFFLEHWPRDTVFLNLYTLTARPPLTNIMVGVFLQVTRADFAHFQLIMTLLGSLAFLPAALLAHRFGRRQAMAVLAVLMMLNPLFMQNSTFPWTKLPAAFFVLLALVFFLRAHDTPAPRAAPVLFGASLAAGLLAHYSAGPYAVMLAAGWFVLGWPGCRTAGFWRATGAAAAAGTGMLATWLGWAVSVYGPAATFLGNTTVSERAPTFAAQFGRIVLNLRDTLVPHFLRAADFALLQQTSFWGWWRDWFFQLYQLNLLFAFGCAGWLVLLREMWRGSRESSVRRLWSWIIFTLGCLLLGVGVAGARDTWGLTHICLQSLVLLGLAYLAARWPKLGSGWRWIFAAGLAIDFVAGIVLHFCVQGYLLDRWLSPDRTQAEMLLRYTRTATVNLQTKLQNHLDFWGDIFTPHPALVLALLGAILTLALTRTVHVHSKDYDRHPDF